MITEYPSTRQADHVYYRHAGRWWKRHTSATHEEAERVYLIDVLISVDDTLRADVINETDTSRDRVLGVLADDITNGRVNRVQRTLPILADMALDYDSRISAGAA